MLETNINHMSVLICGFFVFKILPLFDSGCLELITLDFYNINVKEMRKFLFEKWNEWGEENMTIKKICMNAMGIAMFVALTLCLQVPVFENYYLCLGYIVMAFLV